VDGEGNGYIMLDFMPFPFIPPYICDYRGVEMGFIKLEI